MDWTVVGATVVTASALLVQQVIAGRYASRARVSEEGARTKERRVSTARVIHTEAIISAVAALGDLSMARPSANGLPPVAGFEPKMSAHLANLRLHMAQTAVACSRASGEALDLFGRGVAEFVHEARECPGLDVDQGIRALEERLFRYIDLARADIGTDE